MKILLRNVRIAFPSLFEAKTVNGEGEPAFSATFIIPTDHPAVADINKAIEAVAKEKWGAKAADTLKIIKAKGNTCLRDGADKANYDGFEGNFYMSSRSKQRPLVLDRDKSPLVDADGKPYAGCFVNATVELWAQDNNFGKRVNAQLKAVQFDHDGDAFGGGGVPATPDDFDDLTSGADAGELA